MRICKQCGESMKEGYILKSNTYGHISVEKAGLNMPFSKNSIKSAVCPSCGEISIYTDINK